MARQLGELTALTAALSRAAAGALDPASVLERTMRVLEPVVTIDRADLWRTTRSGLEVAASFQPRALGPSEPLHPDDEAAGALVFPVESRGTRLGQLVVLPPTDDPLGADDGALLDLAATQIAGALERLDLFTEVMELERLKSDFIARVSHELRTPITIISGFLETLIAHDGALDAERRLHMLERSRVAAIRLGHLIEELLTLSRLEGGVLTPKPAPVDVAGLLAEVRATAAEPEQILLGDTTGGTVVTDESLLAQALGLVVDNAIKYGGVAEVSTATTDGRWVVTVRDRGPGFAPDILSTAFEMFARSPTTAMVPGLGVGLAIARTIVEVLDGAIELGNADPGPGAVVRISLRR